MYQLCNVPTLSQVQLLVEQEAASGALAALWGDLMPREAVAPNDAGGFVSAFFFDVLLVPPTRFRPPQTVGDIVAEHPQNTHLAKVGSG